jgi:hypothetical protein
MARWIRHWCGIRGFQENRLIMPLGPESRAIPEVGRTTLAAA